MEVALVSFLGAGLDALLPDGGTARQTADVPAGGMPFVGHLLKVAPEPTRALIELTVKELWAEWCKFGLPNEVATLHLSGVPALLEKHRIERDILVGAIAVARSIKRSGRSVAVAPARRLATIVVAAARDDRAFSRGGLSETVTFFFIERLFALLLTESALLIQVQSAVAPPVAAKSAAEVSSPQAPAPTVAAAPPEHRAAPVEAPPAAASALPAAECPAQPQIAQLVAARPPEAVAAQEPPSPPRAELAGAMPEAAALSVTTPAVKPTAAEQPSQGVDDGAQRPPAEAAAPAAGAAPSPLPAPPALPVAAPPPIAPLAQLPPAEIRLDALPLPLRQGSEPPVKPASSADSAVAPERPPARRSSMSLPPVAVEAAAPAPAPVGEPEASAIAARPRAASLAAVSALSPEGERALEARRQRQGREGPLPDGRVAAFSALIRRLQPGSGQSDEIAQRRHAAAVSLSLGNVEGAVECLQVLKSLPIATSGSSGFRLREAQLARAEAAEALADIAELCDDVAASTRHLATAIEQMPAGNRSTRWRLMQRQVALLVRLAEEGGDETQLRLAINAYRQTGTLTMERDAPYEWATTEVEVATLLTNLGRRHGGLEELGEAVTRLDGAIAVFSRLRTMDDWAIGQLRLGAVLELLGSRGTNRGQLEQAITCFQAGLGAMSLERMPQEWEECRIRLGLTLLRLAEMSREAAPLIEAITHLREVVNREPVGASRHGFTLWELAASLADATQKLSGLRHEPELLAVAATSYRTAIANADADREPHVVAVLYDRLGACLWRLGGHRRDLALLDGAAAAKSSARKLFEFAGDAERAGEIESELHRLNDLAAGIREEQRLRGHKVA